MLLISEFVRALRSLVPTVLRGAHHSMTLVASRRRLRHGTRRTRLAPAAFVSPLEPRVLLSAVTVNTAADDTTSDNFVTLREAVAILNDGNVADGVANLGNRMLTAGELAQINTTDPFGTNDTVLFDAALNGTPILLDGTTFSDIDITKSLTIQGNGAANTVVDAQQRSRFFDISDAAANVTLERLTLQNGRTTSISDNGGAIRSSATGSSLLTIRDAVLTGNSTTGIAADGGAVYLGSDDDVLIERSTLSGNFTQANGAAGGAIYSVSSGDISIRESTLTGNSTAGTVSVGGAVYNTFGTLTIVDSTLSGNSAAASNGGAIYSDTGTVILVNSTVAFNTATGSVGGGISSFTAPVRIRNSIVAGNTDDGTAPDIRTSPSSLTVSHSLIGTNVGTDLTEDQDGDASGNFIGGTSGGVIDPKLAPLAFNGGPTQTHDLLADSLALNHGSNALAVDPSNGNAALTTDQRGAGFARIILGKVDMGAVEAHIAGTIVVDNATDEDDGNYGAGNLSLREAVRLANENTGAADTITFATTLDGAPILLDGTTFGHIDITDSLTITGNGAGLTVLDAQQRSRIFDISGAAANVTIEGVTLQKGRTTANSDDGGAIRANASGASLLTIRDSVLSGNSTTGNGADGGALYLGADDDLVVERSTLSGNFTTNNAAEGGAIYSATTGDVTIRDCTLSGNSTAGTSSEGGAICNYSGVLTITNSTLSGNSTTGGGSDGGAVYSYTGQVTVTNSTLSLNRATSATGGAFFSYDAPITIQNSIVAGNTDNGAAPDIRNSSFLAPPTVSHSLIGTNVGTDLIEDQDGDAAGNFIGGTIDGLIDPKLAVLAFNGGPTQTHALLSDSLALNSGDDSLAVDPSNGNAALANDQRGAPFSRIFGSAVDMGAYERQTLAGLSLVVDNATDENDGDYSAGDLSLREALGLANGSVGTDAITFAPALNGPPLFVTLGQMTITDSVIITGNGATQTVLDAGQNSRFFEVTGDGADFTLEGVTLKNGQTSAFLANGGAIASNSASPNLVTIRDSVLSDNSTLDAHGGAVYLANGNALLVERSTLTRNETGPDFSGGAIYAVGTGTLTIVASTLSDNVADEGLGGAIASGSHDLVVRDSTLSGNQAGTGGAVFGIVGQATFVNSTVSGNQSTYNGGGLFVQFVGLTVVNSTITRNHSDQRGGGIVTNGFNATLVLRNSIVSGNTAALFAPDFYYASANTPAVLRNSLLGDNQGSGLAATGTATTPGTNGNFIGTHAKPIDAGLGALADNGGPTLTHALLPTSRAINRGNNALAVDPSNGNAALAFDQRGTGFNRVRAGTVDMGAVEHRFAPVINNFGAGVVWTEGPNPVLIAGALTTVVDADATNLNGGSLTVALTNNAQPGDVLAIRNQGVGAGKIGVAFNTVTFGGVTIGTFAGGTNGNPLVITFTSAAATPAAVAALLKNITFSSVSDDPTNATRTVSATLVDTDGNASVPVTKTVAVTPVNDAPLLQNFDGQVTFTENGPPVVLDPDATVVDADSANFDKGVLQATIYVGAQTTDWFTVKNGATMQGGVVATNGFNITVDGVHIGTIKDGQPHSTLTILLNANATPARVTALVQALQFHNVSDTPSATTRKVQITLTDGDNGSVINKLKTIQVVPTNDAPTIGGVAALPNFAGQPQLLFGAATLTDPDSPHFNGGTLTLQPTGGFQTGDRLGIRNQGVGLGKIGVSGANITYGGQVIGTFAGGADGAPLTITFTTAKATLAAVQALLRNLTFNTTSNVLGPRTLTATLTEADATTSNIVNQTVQV